MNIYFHDSPAGPSLEVQYSRDAENNVRFESVRVLDAQYRPVGPDLSAFLDSLAVLSHNNGNWDAEKFLSTLVTEIDEHESKMR